MDILYMLWALEGSIFTHSLEYIVLAGLSYSSFCELKVLM